MLRALNTWLYEEDPLALIAFEAPLEVIKSRQASNRTFFEDMIDRYLDKGDMFALFDDDLKSICVVTREDDHTYELKNIATYEQYQGKGYGRRLVEHLFDYYKGTCHVMYVGTGDSPNSLTFYGKCGFKASHVVKNFFTDHYDHPMYDCGEQLIDMIYLKKEFD